MRAPLWATLAATFAALSAGGAAAQEQAFAPRPVIRGLDAPVLLTSAPGEPGTLYVVEQPGRVLQVRQGRRRVFLDLRRQVEYGGEQGLLGLAFHPRYPRTRFLYVAYTSRSDRNVVVRYRSDGRRVLPRSARVLLSVPDPYSNHNGGHLAFGPDGMLYTSIGDGGAAGDPEDRAQDPGSLFGKLLRLDVSRPGARFEIAALGLRNPWRFSFDRATGDLYIGDVGQREVEEVNYTPRRSPGLENYGWDLYEGSRRFEDGEQGPGQLVFPVFEYGHDEGCSVIGGYVYRGRARPALHGRYVAGDFCSGRVWSFRVEDGRARDLRQEPFRIDQLSSFGEDAAGELYAVSLAGVVYRLT